MKLTTNRLPDFLYLLLLIVAVWTAALLNISARKQLKTVSGERVSMVLAKQAVSEFSK